MLRPITPTHQGKTSLTPQQRWQQFRARLPILTWRQKLGLFLGISATVLGFTVVILPFLLPLGGFPPQPLSELQDPNGAFIQVNGYEIYYIHNDANSAETVLLIHGFGGSVVDWRDTLAGLSDYRVYAVDLLGFGLSEKGLALDLSQQAQADMLADFMTTHGIEQAHIVGHDMGGNVAVHLAQRHPEKVKTLTLVAAALQYDPTTPIPNGLFEISFLQRWARILVRAIMPETTEINFYSAAEKEAFITPEVIEASQRIYHTENWDLALLAVARDASRSYLAEPLQRLAVPTLIIWGDLDKWLAPLTAEKLKNDIPNAQLVMLSGVGHLPMWEASEAFQRVLRQFWAEVPR